MLKNRPAASLPHIRKLYLRFCELDSASFNSLLHALSQPLTDVQLDSCAGLDMNEILDSLRVLGASLSALLLRSLCEDSRTTTKNDWLSWFPKLSSIDVDSICLAADSLLCCGPKLTNITIRGGTLEVMSLGYCLALLEASEEISITMHETGYSETNRGNLFVGFCIALTLRVSNVSSASGSAKPSLTFACISLTRLTNNANGRIEIGRA